LLGVLSISVMVIVAGMGGSDVDTHANVDNCAKQSS